MEGVGVDVYYNEIDPKAAAWLRELIKQGHIAPGEVDERSIEDVTPNDLRGYTQCHFFAGIGVWSYALRQSGWSDDIPVWTGSCPCQPFSAAGKGKGFADERHLWPAFHWLIEQCRPVRVFGEQVAGKAGETWLDLVSTDLENSSYTVGAAVTAACGFGAPHQRKRLYWVADNEGSECSREVQKPGGKSRIGSKGMPVRGCGDSGGVAVSELCRRERQPGERPANVQRQVVETCESRFSVSTHGTASCGMADSSDDGLQRGIPRGEDQKRKIIYRPPGRGCSACGYEFDIDALGKYGCPNCFGECLDYEWPITTNGQWRDADWLFCRDGKWRAVEPGTFPLVNGSSNRVVKLRGYGNAIVSSQAQAFIESYMEIK